MGKYRSVIAGKNTLGAKLCLFSMQRIGMVPGHPIAVQITRRRIPGERFPLPAEIRRRVQLCIRLVVQGSRIGKLAIIGIPIIGIPRRVCAHDKIILIPRFQIVQIEVTVVHPGIAIARIAVAQQLRLRHRRLPHIKRNHIFSCTLNGVPYQGAGL